MSCITRITLNNSEIYFIDVYTLVYCYLFLSLCDLLSIPLFRLFFCSYYLKYYYFFLRNLHLFCKSTLIFGSLLTVVVITFIFWHNVVLIIFCALKLKHTAFKKRGTALRPISEGLISCQSSWSELRYTTYQRTCIPKVYNFFVNFSPILIEKSKHYIFCQFKSYPYPSATE